MIAVAGVGHTELMGLGFPEQTMTWDAAVISSTTLALMEEQSPARPLRTQNGQWLDSNLCVESID